MRFANLSYQNRYFSSLGDQVQLLALDHIYQQCGIDLRDVVYIEHNKTQEYQGETVILPINMPLCDFREHGFAERFSDKIIPLFLGLTLMRETLYPEEIDYFKRFEPIGCRDEHTYCTLTKYGISAYLGGCITAVLPRRTQASPKKSGKVFLMDPPEGILRYIPEGLLERAEFDTQVVYHPGEDARQAAVERYKRYHDEASLVITSRMHASVPCMAMGIPVILARDRVSYRLGWLEKLLHIYTPDEYEKMDWAPAAVDYEAHKRFMMEFIKKRLLGKECQGDIEKIHRFYMDRVRHEYEIDLFQPIKTYLDNMWPNKDGPYRYSVWGLTEVAEYTVDYISQRYPAAQLCHAYDVAHTYSFRGVTAQQPDHIADYPEEVVFVTAYAACRAAKLYFEKIGIPSGRYVLCSQVSADRP